jgi:hypothetical protein
MRAYRALLLLPACLPLIAAGAEFDGARPLLCTAQQVVDVAGPRDIETGLPAEMGMPTFMRVDLQRKQIAGKSRTTPIKLMEREERQLTLQGTELGYGWTLVLNEADGTLTGSMVDDIGAIAIFGVCMPQ